nr:reverse transcriptase domain-containing protein [Tanacetum cinerariifolium]
MAARADIAACKNRISLLVKKMGDEEHSTSAWMNFIVVRSSSPYNEIIGRPGVRRIQAVPSTAHGMLKFPVMGGMTKILSVPWKTIPDLTTKAIETPLSSPIGTMWCLCDPTPLGWRKMDAHSTDFGRTAKLQNDILMFQQQQEDTTSVIDHYLGEMVLGKPFVKEIGLVYNKEEGAVIFEKGNEMVIFKIPHKMERFKHIDFKEMKTDCIPPFVIEGVDVSVFDLQIIFDEKKLWSYWEFRMDDSRMMISQLSYVSSLLLSKPEEY